MQEASLYRDDDALKTVISGYAKELKERQMTPGEKLLQGELAEIERERQLFSYAIDNAIQRQRFINPSHIESTETTVVPMNADVERFEDRFKNQEQLAKLARENPQEYLRLRREFRNDQLIEQPEVEEKEQSEESA